MTLPAPTQLLLSLLALPPSSLPSSLSNPPVHSTLAALLSHSTPATDRDTLRPLLHALVHCTAQLPKSPLDLTLLALYLHSFLPFNHALAKEVVQDALANNVRLAGEIRGAGVEALKHALAEEKGDSGAARTLLSLVQGMAQVFVPPAGGAAGAEAAKNLVQALVVAYEPLSSSEGENQPFEQANLRLAILETAHTLFDALAKALVASTSHNVAAPLEELHSLLSLLLPSAKSASIPLSALAVDLQSHYSLAQSLILAITDAGAVGPVARQVKDQVGALRRAAEGEEVDAAWLGRLRREESVGGAAEIGMGVDKEEGTTRAGKRPEVREDGVGAEKEAEIASSISQLVDLFPDLSPSFLRSCLLHPVFSPSPATPTSEATERVVSALLEDDLPADLKALRDGDVPLPPPSSSSAALHPPSPAHGPAPAPPSSSRANIYDDDLLFSRGKLLVGGKDRKVRGAGAGIAGTGKIELDESLKASIIALAEAPSSDEEADGEGGEGEAFLEEEGGEGERAVKVGDGEAKDGEGESDEEEQGDGPQGGGTAASSSAPLASSSRPPRPAHEDPSVLLLLESTYLRTPALFNRDSATRRSKARKELRERTGLGDEQVEGWKTMLERDPKKLARLQNKHQDLAASGNRPAPAPAPSSSSQPSQQPPRQQQQGGRGGSQGGGRGGGRGGGQAGRGGKKGDGGRKESDRAVRGRDKKMQRMGTGL
ncbi:hypothetical protein JCM8547_008382 [Rhodosporidiobolus lusitaniae]